MIFSTIVSLRNKYYDSQKNVIASKIPVISIGNISSGGTGKTPTCILLASKLQEMCFQPICIGRNIHPSSKKTILSEPKNPLGAEIIGDELCLIQEKCSIPILSTISKSKAAIEFEDLFLRNLEKPVYIIDDGFQHRAISRVVDIVLVDNETILGRLIPFGKNREPLSSLKRADIVLNFCENSPNEFFDQYSSQVFTAKKTYSKPYFFRKEPQIDQKQIFVISSIAKPKKFRQDLLSQGYLIMGYIDFADHHSYTEKDIRRICQEFQNSKSSYFVTTEKDVVKLKKYSDFCNSFPILVCPQIVTIDDETKFIQKIVDKLPL